MNNLIKSIVFETKIAIITVEKLSSKSGDSLPNSGS